MGEISQKIIKVDKEKLLVILNEAFAEEWLAYYQYWIGAKVATGIMRGGVEKEFIEHANEELEHAEMLATRIIELGGTPILDPKDWQKFAKCKYDAPKDDCCIALVKSNLASERCAISRYQEIAELCDGGKDYRTFQMVIKILQDEIEHEQEMEDFLSDFEKMKSCKK